MGPISSLATTPQTKNPAAARFFEGKGDLLRPDRADARGPRGAATSAGTSAGRCEAGGALRPSRAPGGPFLRTPASPSRSRIRTCGAPRGWLRKAVSWTLRKLPIRLVLRDRYFGPGGLVWAHT